MKKLLPAAAIGVPSLSLFHFPPSAQAAAKSVENLNLYEKGNKGLEANLLGRYTSGTEIVVYDANSFHAFSMNSAASAIDIIDLSGLKKNSTADIPLLKRIPLNEFGVEASDLTSVAIHPDGGYIAVSVPAADKSGDVAPEGMTFMPAEESPTVQELLLAAHEVSGAIAAYSLEEGHKRNKR